MKDELSNIKGLVEVNKTNISNLETKTKELDTVQSLFDTRLSTLETQNAVMTDVKKSYEEATKKLEISRLCDRYHSFRLNVIIYGIKKTEVWENFDDCEKAVRQVLRDGLQYENADSIKIVDVHRLQTSNNSSSPPPMIFKVETIQIKRDIMKCGYKLKTFNENRSCKVNISVHLPSEMQADKKALITRFKTEKRAGNKPGWRVDISSGQYCLYVNDTYIHPPKYIANN